MKKFPFLMALVTSIFVIAIIVVAFSLPAPKNQLSLSKASQFVQQTPHMNNEGKLNINLATAAEFMQLPGIGEVLAGRIIEYRAEHGPFSSIQDLTKVKGIGEAKLNAIIALICTE